MHTIRRGIATVLTALLALGSLAVGTLGFSHSASAATTSVDVAGQTLQFGNTVKIGHKAFAGVTHRYAAVATVGGQVVDAIVRVTERTPSNLTIQNIDRVSSTNNGDLWSNFQIPSGGGQVTYNVSFVAGGTSDPVTVQNLRLNVGDIDSKQYVQFSGVQSHVLAANSVLSVQTNSGVPAVPVGAIRFAETADKGAVETDQRYWTQVEYSTAVSAVDITLGATRGGSALFEVAFGSAAWTVPTSTTTVPQASVSYTVSYHSNGASSGSLPANTTQNGGVAHTVAANSGTLVRPSATFAGWNTREDGTGVHYAASDTIVPTADTTLYAQWNQSVTTTYNANGATAGSAPSAVTTSSGLQTVSAPGSLVRAGYEFSGWSTAADGTGYRYEPGASFKPMDNLTLYAVWTPLPTLPAGEEVDISVTPGAPVDGGEVPYVVSEVQPGSSWTISADPPGQGDSNAIELDAGTASSSGTVTGSTTLPALPAGEYQLEFEGTATDGTSFQITLDFVVAADGTITSVASNGVRGVERLVDTGMSGTTAVWISVVAVVILIAGAIMVVVDYRRKKIRSSNKASS